jgi:hypothetical protein
MDKYMEIKEGLLTLGDPVRVGEYMQMLGVNNDDLNDPFRFGRFEDICKFLNTLPDPAFFIYKAVGSKQIDRLDFIHEYMHFYQEKKVAEKELEEVNKTIEFYTRDDLTEIERLNLNDFLEQKYNLEVKVRTLQTEIEIYEK